MDQHAVLIVAPGAAVGGSTYLASGVTTALGLDREPTAHRKQVLRIALFMLSTVIVLLTSLPPYKRPREPDSVRRHTTDKMWCDVPARIWATIRARVRECWFIVRLDHVSASNGLDPRFLQHKPVGGGRKKSV